MRWQVVALECGGGVECQQNTALAHLEEDVMARLFAHDPQAEDIPVEVFGGVEVVGIDGGFDDGMDVHRALPRLGL